jgi:hypothetical protein
MDNVELARALSSLPLTVLLVLVLVGGYTGWWIYGSIHQARIADLMKEIETERARAEKWEARYMARKNGAED